MLRLPPKNRSQGIYWTRFYLDHVAKPPKSSKEPKVSPNRARVLAMRNCFDSPIETYPQDIQEFLYYLEDVLGSKRITEKSIEKAVAMIKPLLPKYTGD